MLRRSPKRDTDARRDQQPEDPHFSDSAGEAAQRGPESTETEAGPGGTEFAIAIEGLGRAVAGLRDLIGEQQIDVGARVRALEERIGRVEKLAGELVPLGPASGGSRQASRAGGDDPATGANMDRKDCPGSSARGEERS